MTTLAIIPVRYASRRLPGKPLADIAGKPMIQHVYERASRAASVDDILVATDDERIAEVVTGFGGNAVMTPRDIQSGTDRIATVARTRPEASIIVNVQGDEPLIAPEMIDQAVQPLQFDPALVASTLVRKIETEQELINPNIPKVVLDIDGNCLYFSRSVIPFNRDVEQSSWAQRLLYYRHIGLYVFRREFLLEFATMEQTPLELAEKLEQLRILEHGYRIRAVKTEHDSVPVDTAEDLERVRALFRKEQ